MSIIPIVIVELNMYSPLPTINQYFMIVTSLYLIEYVLVVTYLRLTTALLSLYLFLRLAGNWSISAEMESSLCKNFPGRVIF